MVPKTPPREDKQPQYQTPRRNRQVVTNRQPPEDYTDEDRPEIPKIRRASRMRTPYQFPESITKDQGSIEEQRKGDRSQKQHPDTIKATKKRASSAFTSPPLARRPRRDLLKRAQQDRFVFLRANQPIIIICGLLFVALVIGAIIFNAAYLQPHTQNTVVTNGTYGNQQPGTLPSGLQHNGNPHELVIIPQDTDHPPPSVSATSAYLLDADTGATLYAYNPFMHLPMMSTTKLMTAVLAVEQGNLDQNITITPSIARDISQLSADSTVVGIKQGETYSLRDLLYGLLLKSGNDAAIVIADSLGGSLPHFVAQMNQRARQLGLNDTHYMNPHGLLATGHYSSAHDLAILGQYSMSNPLIHKISGTLTYIIPQGGNHPVIPLVNGNQFLWWYPGTDGGKPGYDGTANFVQVISTTRNHHHLIGVTMHTNNWWTDMRNLMNWGFSNFKWVSPRDLDSAQNPIPFDYLWNYFASDQKENTLPTADGGRYYIYTGYSISGPIMAYYDKGGGLQKYGYPISLPAVSSSAVISQRFEKATIQCDLTTKQCSSQ
jgi:D-alanyl-D-alanine carboxypeptidase